MRTINSKFLKPIIYNHILSCVREFHILCENQYRYRKNHSTTHALIDSCDKIYSALNPKEHAVGNILDLSNAFSMVNHEILFDKLYHHVSVV